MIKFYTPHESFEEIVKPATVDGKVIVIEVDGNPYKDQGLQGIARQIDVNTDKEQLTELVKEYVLYKGQSETAKGKPVLNVFHKKYLEY